MDIVIGRGIDDILFGCSESVILSKLGPCDKTYLSDDGDHRLCYHDMRCAFWFRDDRLHWIRCAHSDLTIFGEKLHGQSKDDVMNFLMQHIREEPEAEDFGEWESHTFWDNWLELQFDYNALKEVCIGHLYGEDDEPVWPVILKRKKGNLDDKHE